MNKMKKLAFAVFAAVCMSGCASTQVAGLASPDATGVAQAQAEQKVSRALPSYGSRGGYRFRRFAAVAATS